jgi:hypothetical protein
MTQSDNIAIYNNGMIHIINREPYETNMDVYKRGWFIIKNKHLNDDKNKLISISLMDNYKNKGMVYDMESTI